MTVRRIGHKCNAFLCVSLLFPRGGNFEFSAASLSVPRLTSVPLMPMSDPDHTLDLAPSPSRGGGRGGGRKKSAARQNSNRARRSAGAAGLIDESGERIDELIV